MIDALRDANTAVARAAAMAILSARVEESAAPLEAYLSRIPHQERTRLERMRRQHQKPQPDTKRIERLEEKIRKLEEKLARRDSR